MKAILVIGEMPTECIECPFHRIYADGWLNETHCILTAKRNKDGVNTRAEWCPLKPMPKEEDIYEVGMNEEDTNAKRQWNKGWNACIDGLLGETE